ncbi:DUF3515 domain-containing protein [Streptomyces sp. NBC_00335]|uniref:DUF3515 family protein n=1 Tax=unclassified Streptomyces TaxID=2593676 RepID=UPI0022580768|nr:MULTISPECIES: DUF3515 family protein [unclassified Streptomyces]MCX5402456.1 DUF3515 domain-containing protein [Streptomyces sp. NBC_00086]
MDRKKKTLLTGLGVLGLAAAGTFALTGARSVEPGPFAGDPQCRRVLAQLPDELLGEERDSVKGAGAASWGDGTIVLRCGVAPLAPTINTCMNVNGTDWVLDEERATRGGPRVVTTYGRIPSVELAFNEGDLLAGDALVVIDKAVRDIPQQSPCIGLSET